MRRSQYVTSIEISRNPLVRDAAGERCAHTRRFDNRFRLCPLFAAADEDEVTARTRIVDSRGCFGQHGGAVPWAERAYEPDDGPFLDTKCAPNLAAATVRMESVCIDAVRVYYELFGTDANPDQIAAFNFLH